MKYDLLNAHKRQTITRSLRLFFQIFIYRKETLARADRQMCRQSDIMPPYHRLKHGGRYIEGADMSPRERTYADRASLPGRHATYCSFLGRISKAWLAAQHRNCSTQVYCRSASTRLASNLSLVPP